jgi:cystathionine beta-lyase
VTGFNLVTHALAQQPGAVLVQTPVYPPFLSAAKHAAMQRQDALLVPDAAGVYHVDWEAFEAAITPETRLFILCNPHNPVGRVFTPAELARMAEICLRHGVQICSDEIHCDLLFDGRQHTPIAALDPEIARHTVTLMAPSKTYNLAGLEGSFAIIQDRALREQVQAAGKGLVGWVNLMALVATEAAYRDGQDWLDQVLAYLQANRDFVSQTVAADLPGVKVAPAEGTYLAWLDCRGRDLPQPPGKFFLEKAKVALNEGATFGAGGAGFVRLNFGCPRATLTEALARMAEALASSSLASSSLASSSLASHS